MDIDKVKENLKTNVKTIIPLRFIFVKLTFRK